MRSIQVSGVRGGVWIINKQNKTEGYHCVIGQGHKQKAVNQDLREVYPQNSTSVFTVNAILDPDREIQEVLQEQLLAQKQKGEVVQIDLALNTVDRSNVERAHEM